ncbi:hypothetical protein EFU29_13905 [Vibrio cholerae]|nr:hypothetical protein [Vibrio cholerae]
MKLYSTHTLPSGSCGALIKFHTEIFCRLCFLANDFATEKIKYHTEMKISSEMELTLSNKVSYFIIAALIEKKVLI